MSSNVLKNVSDCYNFKDENNTQSKTKVKQRQRLRTNSLTSKLPKSQSLTSKSKDVPKVGVNKENPKKDHKWRCDVFKEILESALWLNDIRAESRSSIDLVLELLEKHMSEDCNCVNVCSSHLLIGNTYFESFLFNRKEFEKKVIYEENKELESKTMNDSKTSNKNYIINDIPSHKESKLESTIFPDLVNLNNMTTLLAPLEKAVDYWEKAFELSLKMKILSEEAVIAFKVYYNLSSVIQIYSLYNQIEFRLKSALLLTKYCQYYGSKYSEISLTANYYLVKTYLELGSTNKAANCLTRMPSSSSSKSQSNQRLPETFGKSLNFLLKCEIDFMTGRSETASKSLKSFIDSEYLQKLTINRYYVKGLSLLMATKFMSKDFDFSKYFQEFLEPVQMSLSILKRWNPWLSTSAKTNNENQIINSGDLDPLWYKFAVMNFAFDSIQMSANFYANIEMPFDAIFYFNALIKLGRRYCASVRISKLLIIGSHLDVICDQKASALTKLSNASLCLQLKSSSYDSDSIFSSVSTISPDTRRAIGGYKRHEILESDSEIEVIEVNSYEYNKSEDCEHNKNCDFESLWNLKKKFRRNNSSVSDDSIQEIGRNINKESFDETRFPKGILELFFTKIEVDLQKLLVNETDSKYIFNQINDILKNSFESYSKNVLRQQIEELISDYRLEELYQNCDYYKSLKFKISETIARMQFQMKEFMDAINTCNEIKGLMASTYEQRVNQSNLLYFEAFSKLELYKTHNNINEDKVWVEYNSFLDIPSKCASSGSQSLTPTRPENKVKACVPKAPKHKPYINDEIQDYVTALSNCIYEESKANTSSDKNPFRMKSHLKLNLENDTEIRSVSVSETNEGVVGTDISTVISSKSKTIYKPSVITERMTRSRTSSLTASIKCPQNKVEKKTKRSTAKASKISSNSSEVIELNTDSEELDEVFEKLTLNENKLNENELSLESIISILKLIFDLMASHPTSKLYVNIHKLLTQIYSISDEINEELIGYHFSESIRSTYRYRNLFIAEKKRKLNKSSKYDLNSVFFSETNFDSNNSSKIFTDCLPIDWRIIQIMAVENDTKIPELMVCRYQSGKKPVYLRIKSDPQKIIKHFMTHFVEIIERSNASIVNRDRETFWRLRYSLDEELMVLLNSVEDTWFGPFKGILFGQIQSQSYHKMCRKLCSYFIQMASTEDLNCVNEPLLRVLIESLPLLNYNEMKASMKVLFNFPSDSLIEKCFAKYEEMFSDVFPIDDKQLIFSTYHLSPVGLILDKSLDAFPFECLPTLHRINQSVFRIPSLRILSLMYNTFKDGIYSKGVDQSKVYYVLNPSDNLPKTEDFFKNSFLTMKEWEGVIGKSPNPLELKEALESKDAYVFFGHGAGASYYRTMPDGLDGCTVNCASIVIGCSSGKLFSDGKQLESFGTSYRFLMNGCPSYVGVLWDVTDKDIDKFSDFLLSYWFSKYKPELSENKKVIPISKAVSLSRQFCRLKYLIGAAPVVYGLPLSSQI